MSRTAVISCLHGNIAALEAVHSDIRAQKVDRIVSLGDLIGYGPYPNEVVRYILKHNISSIRGCWEEAVIENKEDCGCKFVTPEDAELGKRAFEWTRARLSPSNRKFIGTLDFAFKMSGTDKNGSVLFVHGSPRSSTECLTETTHDLVLFERAAAGDCDILVCGHTHVPFARRVSGTLEVRSETGLRDEGVRALSGRGEGRTVRLKPKMIVNAGSVGEPRHGGPEATYVIIDPASYEVEVRKVEYDVRGTADAMDRLGLPEAFGARLTVGRELALKDKAILCAC
jgi:predicted phosphodiesterase